MAKRVASQPTATTVAAALMTTEKCLFTPELDALAGAQTATIIKQEREREREREREMHPPVMNWLEAPMIPQGRQKTLSSVAWNLRRSQL